MSKIPNKPEEIFEEIVSDYKTALGADLISIILYGSGARGEYIPQKSDINFLIALSEDSIDCLHKTFKLVSKWRKRRVSTPLFLTKSYIQSSLDIFPIEFLNLKTHYTVIYGEDVLRNLSIENKFLRLQGERELKGKLLQLRQQFLETEGNKNAIENLIARSASTFYSIFRAILFLLEKAIPCGRDELLSLVAHAAGLDRMLFLDIIKIKEGNKKFTAGEAVSFMEKYIEQIKKLAAFVDELKM